MFAAGNVTGDFTTSVVAPRKFQAVNNVQDFFAGDMEIQSLNVDPQDPEMLRGLPFEPHYTFHAEVKNVQCRQGNLTLLSFHLPGPA